MSGQLSCYIWIAPVEPDDFNPGVSLYSTNNHNLVGHYNVIR